MEPPQDNNIDNNPAPRASLLNNETIQPKVSSRYLKAKHEREIHDRLRNIEIDDLKNQLQDQQQTSKGFEDSITRLKEEKQTLQEQLDRATAKNVELEQNLQKQKRTQKEIDNLRTESGPTRVGYRHEPYEILNSTFISIHETLKKYHNILSKPAPLVYGSELPESLDAEARASLSFLQRNIYRPNSIINPAKRVRRPPTQDELDRMAACASAAEKRLVDT